MNDQEDFDPAEADVNTIVDTVAWNPDGTLLALAYGDYFGPENQENLWVRVVDVGTGQVIFTTSHEGRAELAWSPAGEELYVVSDTGAIQRYHVATGAVQAALDGRDSREWSWESMSLSPDGSRIAAIFSRPVSTQEITIYDAQTLQPVARVDLGFTKAAENALSWIGYNPDGTLLATTGWDGIVRIWSADTLSPLVALVTSPGERLLTGDWSIDGRLAVGGTDRHITIWNVSAEQIINSFDVASELDGLSWHPDGRQIAADAGGVWDTITGQQVQSIGVRLSSAIDWSPSGVLAYGIWTVERLQIDPDANPVGILVFLLSVPPLQLPTPPK